MTRTDPGELFLVYRDGYRMSHEIPYNDVVPAWHGEMKLVGFKVEEHGNRPLQGLRRSEQVVIIMVGILVLVCVAGFLGFLGMEWLFVTVFSGAYISGVALYDDHRRLCGDKYSMGVRCTLRADHDDKHEGGGRSWW